MTMQSASQQTLRMVLPMTGGLEALGGGMTVYNNVIRAIKAEYHSTVRLTAVISRGQERFFDDGILRDVDVVFAPAWSARNSFLNRFVCEQLWLPFMLVLVPVLRRSDCIFGVGNYVPFLSFKKKISFYQINSFYDAIPKEYQRNTWFKLAQAVLGYVSMKSSDRVIFPSYFMMKETLKKWPFISARSFVLYEGVEDGLAMNVAPNVQSSFGEYVCYPSVFRPYKNHLVLINAFRVLKEDPRFKDVKLVFTGSYEHTGDPVVDQYGSTIYQNHSGDKDIIFLGHISRQKLQETLAAARIVVLPSKWEGFGLPVLEAFRIGTPVIVSDRGSLPEVAGDAALVFSADDSSQLAGMLKTLFLDEGLRQELITKGRSRMSEFTWERFVTGVVHHAH